jgi:geranylgeranyl diphosphate synthase, type I
VAPCLPPPESLRAIAVPVDARLREVLDGERDRWSALDRRLAEPLDALTAFVLDGGKRLRPAFCHWAFVGAGGDEHDRRWVDAGCALELLHAFALIHDDVMDGSDLRRNRATVHRDFAQRHRVRGWNGEGRRFGDGAAILLGDMAFVYADLLMADSPPAAQRIFTEMRAELNVGQYLDLVGAASRATDADTARKIARYKSAKYTVERPLHLGAALAGKLDELREGLSAVGVPLGDAFQLRDDLLGVFGERTLVGKPVGDDLREGKPTPLLAAAVRLAHEHDDVVAQKLLARVGDPRLSDGDVAALGRALVDTGAVAEVEAEIGRLVDEAQTALDGLPVAEHARTELAALARYVAWRAS